MLDNTGELLNGINSNASAPLSATTWRGVSTFWPEVDPTCGPGRYTLPEIYLALSTPTGSLASLTVRLYSADPTTFKP